MATLLRFLAALAIPIFAFWTIDCSFRVPGTFSEPAAAILINAIIWTPLLFSVCVGIAAARRAEPASRRFMQRLSLISLGLAAAATLFNGSQSFFIWRLNASRFALERRAREMDASDSGFSSRQWIGLVPVFDSFRQGDFVVLETHGGLLMTFGVAIDVSGGVPNPRGMDLLLPREPRLEPPLLHVVAVKRDQPPLQPPPRCE